MRDQVARHLERARLAARVAGGRHRHRGACRWCTALARTMEKIHHGRGVAIDDRRAGRGALPRRAAGPRGDGRQPGRQCLQVGAVARGDRGRCRSSPTPAPTSRVVRIVVDDDGPGLTPRSASRWRGAAGGSTRPSRAPGSGSRSWWSSPALYGGALTLGTAPIGGLRAELVLPAGVSTAFNRSRTKFRPNFRH